MEAMKLIISRNVYIWHQILLDILELNLAKHNKIN
jgi:hypothetical protein